MDLEMVCTCGLDGVREAEERRLRIAERMQLPRMSDLATALVLSLAFDFGCDAWLYADMWFGLSLETSLVPEGVYVECDHPIDGLAAAWEALAERFPERVSLGPGLDPETRKRSAELLAACVAADAPYREHRKTVHEGKDGWCDDCSRIHHPYVEAHIALNEAWGSKTLEPAVNAAFGGDS